MRLAALSECPATPHWKRFRLVDVDEFGAHLQRLRAAPGAAEAELPLYNHQEYLLNQGTLLQRVLKEYAHFLHPTLSRDKDSLWAALYDQMRWHSVVGPETSQADVTARAGARAGGQTAPAEVLLQAVCDEFDVIVFGLTFSHACGLKGYRVAPAARRAWQPVNGDRELRSLFLTHFGLHQWRSTLTLAQTLQLYEENRDAPDFSHESWCALLRRIGRYQEALDAAREAAARNPRSDVAESVWGGVLGDLHNHAEALVHHQRQIEVNPNHEQSHNGLGCALHFLENFTAAVPHYEQQLKCNPLNMHSHRNLALALEQLGRREEALAMFEQEVRMYPDFRVAHRSYHLLLAELHKRDLTRALKLYDELEQQFCDKAYFDSLRAAVYLESKDYAKALEILQRVVAINCWDDYALGLLAEVLLEMGRGDEAVEAMRLVVHWTPDHGVAWEALGRIYRRLGRQQDAIDAFRRQMPVFIERYALWNGIAECFLELGKRDAKHYDEAIAAAQVSLEINPQNVLALAAWGAALTSLTKYEEAITVYRRQMAVDTRRVAYAVYNIGLCLQRLSRHQESLQYFQEHLRANPDDVLAMMQVGTEYWYLQDYQQSVQMYKEALALEPTHSQCAFFIGDTLSASMGRHAEALHYFELHERNAPQDLSAHTAWAEAIAMLMKGLLDDSGPSNGSRGDGASGRDVELDAQLDLWERRWIHHLQRSLGVPPDAAFPDAGIPHLAVPRLCRDRFKFEAFWLAYEPPWPDAMPWNPAEHRTMASFMFQQQARAFLLVAARFSRLYQRTFPKPILLKILSLVAADAPREAAELRIELGCKTTDGWAAYWSACAAVHGLNASRDNTGGHFALAGGVVDRLKALSHNSEIFFNVWNVLGVAQCLTRDFVGGVASFERQLELNPGHRVAAYNLAFARAAYYSSNGTLTRAMRPTAKGRNGVDPVAVRSIREAAQQMLTVTPPVKHCAHVMLGLLEERCGSMAALHFARAATICPWDHENLLLWGRFERRAAEAPTRSLDARKRSQQNAVTVLTRLLSRPGPSHALGALQLARALVIDLSEDGNLGAIEQRAIDMFCLALKTAPWRVHKWWGLAEYARGHTVEALRHFELQMALAQLPRNDPMNDCARQIEPHWDELYDWGE